MAGLRPYLHCEDEPKGRETLMKLEMDEWTTKIHEKIRAHDEHEIVTEPVGNGVSQTRCATCDVVLLDAVHGSSDWTREHGGREISVDWYVTMTARVNLETGEVKYVGVACEDIFSCYPDGGCSSLDGDLADDPSENPDDIATAAMVVFREVEAGRAPSIQVWQ